MVKNKIKSSWKEYFNFSARERRGALFLSSIIITQICVLFFLRNQKTSLPLPDKDIIRELELAMEEQRLEKEKSEEKQDEGSFDKPLRILAPFDPNQLIYSHLTNTGLSEKQHKVIANYLKHGGKFRVKSDLRKIYGITEKQYNALEPFLLLPDSVPVKQVSEKKSFSKQLTVDIGTADSVELMKLNGIGPVFSSRIIRYREKLGGFVNKEQLKEVWGFSDSVYQILEPFIELKNAIPFRQLHLNTDSFAVFASHPYIRGKLAGMICSYRKQHQGFSDLTELLKLPTMDTLNFRKIFPYIRID